MVCSTSQMVCVDGWNLTSVDGECLPKNFRMASDMDLPLDSEQ